MGSAMAKKATRAECEQRVKYVMKMLLDGFTRPDILEYCSKEWGLARASIDNLTAQATKRILAINEVECEQLMANVTSNYWSLYREARRNKQTGLASSILAQISKLKGIEKQRVEHSGTVTLADLVAHAKKKEENES